jgi:hypothetical protein
MVNNGLDYNKLINQHCQIIDVLSLEADGCEDNADLTSVLRNTGLALSNLGKLRTLQKRESIIEDDDGIDDLIADAKIKAGLLNGKKA